MGKKVVDMTTYYKGWPHKGHYVKQLKKAYDAFYYYLSLLYVETLNRPCVIMDIDDTILFTDPDNQIGLYHSKNEMLEPNPYIWTIPYICKQMGIDVIILTARNERWRDHTIENLLLHDIPFDELLMNKGNATNNFKIKIREDIRKDRDVVAEIGDQWNDVNMSETSLCLKLPSPDDPYVKYLYPS